MMMGNAKLSTLNGNRLMFSILALMLLTAHASAFEMKEIDGTLKIGYAVVASDVNGDGKSDIVVVDQLKVVWYENPTWKKRVMIAGGTKPDNVTIAAMDLTGDGLPEFVIGAGWKPFDTGTPGTLQWLGRGLSLDEPWSLHPIPNDEPTIHRIRALDLDGDGKPELVSVPLMGRDSTKAKNWFDGRPLRITAYRVPAKPDEPKAWQPMVLNEDLHVAHNFDKFGTGLIVSSYEGLSALAPAELGKPWTRMLLHAADQKKPNESRGASEVRVSAGGTIASIEPWHGNQVVVYTKSAAGYDRTVIDAELRWGHALAWIDEVLIVGIRDNPDPKQGDTHTAKRGVRTYRRAAAGWKREIIDEGGIAVEDLTTADLDGDGKPEIIACGRATGNVRIYWTR